MADEYIDLPIVFDETAIYNSGVARIQSYYPNWTPKPGSFIDIVLRTVAGFAAIGAEVASDVPLDIFLAIGPILGINPVAATPAQATVTITMQDDIGYAVDADTPVGLYSVDQTDPVGFKIVSDAVVPAGQTSISGVTVMALGSGSSGSALYNVFRTDGLSYVASISVDAGSYQDGTDPQNTSDFSSYLVEEFSALTDTPILARDAAKIALQVPGVYRCGFLDNYNPDDGTSNNEKYLCVCPIQSDGNEVGTAIVNQVIALLQSKREWNFVCKSTPPTITAIDIAYLAGIDPTDDTDVRAAAIQEALNTYLYSGTWGASSTGEKPQWTNTPIVRWHKIVQIIEEVTGVKYTENVRIAIHGNALASADVNLPGAFPLPTLGTITPGFTTS